MDSADWAAWVGAVGTVAAFGSGVVVWAYDLVYRRRREDREQAESIAVWLDNGEVFYVNASPLPVMDVYMRTVDKDAGPRPDAGPGQRWRDDSLFPAPAARRWLPDALNSSGEVVSPGTEPGRIYDLDFTDARGQRWRRDANGALFKITPRAKSRMRRR